VKVVAFNTSGALQIAMCAPATSGRMPAVGIVTDNIASGQLATLISQDYLSNTAFNFSGYITSSIYVGASGDLVNDSPNVIYSGSAIVSGGCTVQKIGEAVTSSGLILFEQPQASPITLVVDPTGNGDYRDIQSALNALPKRGGTVQLREGLYALHSGLTLQGSGQWVRSITIRGANPANSANYATAIYSMSGAWPVLSGAASSIKLENLYIRARDLSGTSVLCVAGSPTIEIENCAIGGSTLIPSVSTAFTSFLIVGDNFGGTVKIRNSTIVYRPDQGGMILASGNGPARIYLDRSILLAAGSVTSSGMRGPIGPDTCLYATDSTIYGGIMESLHETVCNNTLFYCVSDSQDRIRSVDKMHFNGCKFYGYGVERVPYSPEDELPASTVISDCSFDGTNQYSMGVSGTTAITVLSGASVHVSNCSFANYLSGDIVICGGPSLIDGGSTVTGCNTIDQQLVVECSGAWGNVYTGNSIYEGVNRTRPPIDTTTGAGISRIVDEQQIDTRFKTGEGISPGTLGSLAVALNSSGELVTAMAGQSGRMPAIGIVNSGAPQGYVIPIWHKGRVQGNFNFSGYRAGNVIYTGYSGEVTCALPTSVSGVLTPQQQPLGVVINGSGVFLHSISPTITSGAIIDAAQFMVDTNFIAAEPISGYRPTVAINTSGLLVRYTGASGRTPAIGLIISGNVASGQPAYVHTFGRLHASGFNFSGYVGSPVHVNTVGVVTGSGFIQSSQRIGVAIDGSGLFVGALRRDVGPRAATYVVDSDLTGDFSSLADAVSGLPVRGGTIFIRGVTQACGSSGQTNSGSMILRSTRPYYRFIGEHTRDNYQTSTLGIYGSGHAPFSLSGAYASGWVAIFDNMSFGTDNDSSQAILNVRNISSGSCVKFKFNNCRINGDYTSNAAFNKIIDAYDLIGAFIEIEMNQCLWVRGSDTYSQGHLVSRLSGGGTFGPTDTNVSSGKPLYVKFVGTNTEFVIYDGSNNLASVFCDDPGTFIDVTTYGGWYDLIGGNPYVFASRLSAYGTTFNGYWTQFFSTLPVTPPAELPPQSLGKIELVGCTINKCMIESRLADVTIDGCKFNAYWSGRGSPDDGYLNTAILLNRGTVINCTFDSYFNSGCIGYLNDDLNRVGQISIIGCRVVSSGGSSNLSGQCGIAYSGLTDGYGISANWPPLIIDSISSGYPSIIRLAANSDNGTNASGFAVSLSSGGLISLTNPDIVFEGDQLVDTKAGGTVDSWNSGSRAICLGPGNGLAIAMPGLSGRMPAIGVSMDTPSASGKKILAYLGGRIQHYSLNFSGQPQGTPVFVGQSGALTTLPNSQIIGTVANSSGMIVGKYSESYLADYFIAEETISGGRAVALGRSGQVIIAMSMLGGSGLTPQTSPRMPAIGVVMDNILSGSLARVYRNGYISFSGWLSTGMSGAISSGTIWVGASGTLTTTRPAAISGIMNPILQTVGTFGPGSGMVDVNIVPVGPANPRPVALVVDPYGNGDFAEIRTAVAALPPQGGMIMLREGRHRVTSGIMIASGGGPITFVGVGSWAANRSGAYTSDRGRGFGTIVDFTNASLSGVFVMGQSAQNVHRTFTFENITFTQQYASGGPLFNVNGYHYDYLVFKNCRIENADTVFKGALIRIPPGNGVLGAGIRLYDTDIAVPWVVNSGACVTNGQLGIEMYNSVISQTASGYLVSGGADGYYGNGIARSGSNAIELYLHESTVTIGDNSFAGMAGSTHALYLWNSTLYQLNSYHLSGGALSGVVYQTDTVYIFKAYGSDIYACVETGAEGDFDNCNFNGVPFGISTVSGQTTFGIVRNCRIGANACISGAFIIEPGPSGDGGLVGIISDVNAYLAASGLGGPLIVDKSFSGSTPRIAISNVRSDYCSGYYGSGLGVTGERMTVEGRQLYDSLLSVEMMSGPCAVTFAGSGYVRMAMAGISGRWPAVGITAGTATSGDTDNSMGVLVRYWGVVHADNFDFASYARGQAIWLGQSGGFANSPPGSGMPQQILGMVVDGSGMFVGNLCPGWVGSGQITQTMLASGVGGGGTVTLTTSFTAGEALSGGEFLVFSGAKIVTLAYASGTWDHASVVAVAAAAAISGASIACETLCGRDVRVQMEASLSGLAAGKPVYLSALDRGACTTIAPTTSGNTSKLLGWISSTSGYLSGSVASSLLSIVFQPGQQILLG